MDISQHIQLKTEQKLVVNQRLQQQLSILHMTLEVADLANEQLQSNPLLDLNEDVRRGEKDDFFTDLSLDALSNRDVQRDVFDDGALLAAGAVNFYRAAKAAGDFSETDFLDYTYKPESLDEYLAFQLADYPLSEKQKTICMNLLTMLDKRGFFKETVEDAAAALGEDVFEVTQMLYVLQSLDPVGVAARDLSECLVLQLAAGDGFNGYTLRIAREMLVLLSQNRIGAIAKELGITPEEAQRHCDAVRALSPIPARGFYTGEENSYIVPDAVVFRSGEELFVQMNDSMVPRLVINGEYEKMLSESRDETLCGYLKEQLATAKNLVSDISARQTTLYRLICEIVKKQPDFFVDGRSLRPMMMAEIAEALELHVSTVSRAIAGKYIVCAAGTISLKSLFTVGYAVNDAGGAVSAAVIKRKLVELIAAEDHDAPLSDEALGKLFEQMNVKISRRTVAKYREEQGIPSSKQRRGSWS